MIKFICKKTNKEVIDFSIVMHGISYRKDYSMLTNSTSLLECDREYFSGTASTFIYTILDDDQRKDIVVELTEKMIDQSILLTKLRSNSAEVHIDNAMIENSKSYGPLLIVKG